MAPQPQKPRPAPLTAVNSDSPRSLRGQGDEPGVNSAYEKLQFDLRGLIMYKIHVYTYICIYVNDTI